MAANLGLSHYVPFTVYASGPLGGPKKRAEAVFTNADEYRLWLGDIDPGFNPGHKHLDGVDFSKEVLIAVGLGDVNLGTTVSINSIELASGGVAGGSAFVRYSVHHPAGRVSQIIADPYVVVKCAAFSGFDVKFLRIDSPPAGLTTMMVGEEGSPPLTTLRLGEEGPVTDPRLDDPIGSPAGALTTQALGEEGTGGPFGGF